VGSPGHPPHPHARAAYSFSGREPPPNTTAPRSFPPAPSRLRSTRPRPISVSRPPPAIPLPFPSPVSHPRRQPLVSTAAPPLSAVGGRLARLARLRPRLPGGDVCGWAALAGRRTHCCCGPKAGPAAGFYFSNTFPNCLIN
jgi:hypothetical protein